MTQEDRKMTREGGGDQIRGEVSSGGEAVGRPESPRGRWWGRWQRDNAGPWRAWRRPSRPAGGPLKAELDNALKRLGKLTMENELLWARVRRPGPLAQRRSKK